jgi:hypothetical protein
MSDRLGHWAHRACEVAQLILLSVGAVVDFMKNPTVITISCILRASKQFNHIDE